MSPSFIRKNLNISTSSSGFLRANDILKTDFAKTFFNDIVTGPCDSLYSCSSMGQVESTFITIMKDLNRKYGIDAYLYADIGTVLLLVLSDCLGESFVRTCRSWVDYLSKALKTLIDLNLTHNEFGSFSLRETMLHLNQPYIEWSDGILSTGYLPIDRQHQWLVTIVNVIIHVNTGNQVHICVSDVIDALHDYAWIHFTEEEALFMNNTNYPQFEIHKKQHDDFLKKLNEMRQAVGVKDETVLSKELQDYCIAWLTNHIRVTDRKMINCCISSEVLQKSSGLFGLTK